MSHWATFENQSSTPKNMVVSVKNLCKSYTVDVPILQNFSMNVEEGQIYGLLGSSGCGKSTALSCIIGLLKWDSGTVTIFGESAMNGISKENIGYMPQDHALYNQLTVREMLKFYAKLYQISDTKLKKRMTLFENLLNLDGYGHRRIGTLSGGQTRRVSLALTMIHKPKLLILDEPTVGLDPLLREKIWNYLFKLTRDLKTTIIITTHYIEEVKYAQRVGVMRRGALLVEDNPLSLMSLHNTPLLEDVVLKICKMDSLRRKQNTAPVLRISSTGNVQETRNNPSVKNRMKNRSLKEVITKPIKRICAYHQVIWINFLRQPIFIILLLVLPLMQLLISGYVVGKDPLDSNIGVVNMEILQGREGDTCSHIMNKTICNLNELSCSLVKHINDSIYMKAIGFTTEEEARLDVQNGNIMGYMEIPRNFSVNMVNRAISGLYAENTTIEGTVIKLNLDMSNTLISYTVIQAIEESFANFLTELSAKCNIDLRRFDVPFFLRNPVYGNKDITITEYVLPALIISIIFQVAFVTAPLVFINDLNTGISARSRVAGLNLWETMIGIFLAMILIAAVQAIICIISVNYFLRFPVQGTAWDFVLICLVTVFCNSAFGLMMGIWLKDTVSVIITAIFVFPVLVLHSGFLHVLEAVPHPYRTIIFYMIPNVSISSSLRWIINNGVNLFHSKVIPGVLITIGWGMAFTIVIAFLLRRT